VIGSEGALLRSSEPVGAARALASLTQLLATTQPGPDGSVTLPAVRMLDAPRFAWRALTLDLACRFFTLHEVKRLIDLISLYKLNVLNLHLTDEQGWRIAAGRPAYGGEVGGPFYSNAELRDLVAYAEQRFVTVVPEVDTPGHARALVQMHPELESGRNLVELPLAPGRVQRTAWLDPDLSATWDVVEWILAEVADTFRSPFISIGGDEPLGMPGALYGEYVRHVHRYVRSLGRRTVGWQETVRAVVDPEHVIQHWISGARGSDVLAKSRRDLERALEHGVPVIASPLTHAHFDVPYAEPSVDPAQEAARLRLGLRLHAPRTLAETFDWDPASILPRSSWTAPLSGVAAAVWAESVRDLGDLTFLLLPRLAGVSEKAWSQAGGAPWGAHRVRLSAHARLWTQDRFTYFKSSTIDWTAGFPGGRRSHVVRDLRSGARAFAGARREGRDDLR
jgi:hexosaminidase